MVYQQFPLTRLRRNRTDVFIRDLLQENCITVNDLILPLFITEGKNIEFEIISMPNIKRYSLDRLIQKVQTFAELGIKAIVLFPHIENNKSLDAQESYNENGLVQNAIRKLKKYFPELGIITDIALDPYTSHGQDGIIDENGYVLNDQTIDILKKQALSHVDAGADVISPSDMMDGRILSLRKELEKNNFVNTKILSYSAKYASYLYGPFRDAVGSKKSLSKANKKTYQMDFANSNEAILECKLDVSEGSDILMIKPASFYLDVIYRVKQELNFPTFAYQVSGEYNMIYNAILNNYLPKEVILESLVSIKRAGSDAILTYFAEEVAYFLKNGTWK